MGKLGKAKAKQRKEDVSLKYQGTTDPVLASWQLTQARMGLHLSMLVDVVITIILFFVVHRYNGHPAIPRSLHDFVRCLEAFHTDTLDLVLLVVLRVAILHSLSPIAAGYARKDGREMEIPPEKKAEANHPCAAAPSEGGKGSENVNGSSHAHENGEAALTQPLLSAENGGEESEEDEKKKVIHPLVEDTDPGWSEWTNSITPKDVTIFFVFLASSVFQVYIGAKCVSFLFHSEALEGWLMGSAVIWINLESTLLSRVAEASGVLGRAEALREKKQQQQAEAAAVEAAAAAAENELAGSASETGGVVQVTTSRAGSSRISTISNGEADEDQLRGDKGVRKEAVVTRSQYLLRAIALAREELPVLAVGFLCLAVTSTAGLIIPNYQGRILDDVIHMDASLFHHDVTLMAIFSLVTGVFGGLRGLCFSIVGKRLLKTLQDRLFRGVIIQDIAYFDATTSGELTSRLTNDVAAMSEPINWQLSALVRNLASLLGGIILCFVTSWKLSMLAFTTMAPILHITDTYSRWSRELNRNRYAVLAEANSAASEALGNIRTVRAFSTEEVEMARYSGKTKAAMVKGVRDAFAYSGMVAINNWLDLGASVLILWYGGVLVMGQRMTIGRLITFQLYWSLIQSGYQNIMSVLTSLTKASGAAQRVLTLIDALPDIDPNSGMKVSHLQGAIQLINVHFHYQLRPEHPVLRGVSLEVKSGQVCALVGRSGGGKSTIVHLLMRFYDPVQGSILLDGVDLRDLNLQSVHEQMGTVAQETQMWATSIEENIAYGMSEYTREAVENAAKQANAHDFIIGFPEGYSTRVGERGVRLSGGQRQRIAIARMLLRRPRVLLLDEATSALDSESEAQVQEALDRLIREGGRTIVLVAHRLSTVKDANIIGVIDKGLIAEQGTHNELLEIPKGVYKKLVQRQLSRQANIIPEGPETSQIQHDNIDSLIEEEHE